MSKIRIVIVYMICCEFFQIRYIVANSSWSALNLQIDDGLRSDNRTRLHTTESYGIVIKTNYTNTTLSTNTPSNHWTQIQVTVPPSKSTILRSKYHATLSDPLRLLRSSTEASAVRSIHNEADSRTEPTTTQVPLTTASNRASAEQLSSRTPPKGINGETGHAFFYDDDDDDDDDYDDDDDDDYIQKKDDDDEDDEEVVDDEKNVEEAAETVDPEAQEEYENYAETRPPIILRTRRKNKRKRGKKHGSIKIKDFKKLRKFMLPLLLAYKLKFFTLVPLLLGGLVLIVATTGFAGFFFALFAVGLGLKHHH